jgi:two-component system NtrC family sensor kinase
VKYEILDFMKANPEFVTRHADVKKSFDYLIGIAESLVENVKRTDNIIKGILTFARTEEKATFFSEFSLREIVNLSLELLSVKHHLHHFPLELTIEGSDVVYGVKSQVMESVFNLMDNAYEAVQDKVKYHLSEEEKKTFTPCVRVTFNQNETVSLLTVSDNGVGITPEQKQKIFAPFFTTKSSYKSGTGIGMYVVKRMVEENHKGKIWFESEPMKGTTFCIELPKKSV